MIEGVEAYLASWLGNASTVGASSWLHWFSWVAALLVAAFAWIAIRRQSLQARAALLLSVYAQWETLNPQRSAFVQFRAKVKNEIVKSRSNLNHQEQTKHLRSAFKEAMIELRSRSDETFHGFVAYISFFEVIGTYVRRGYVPLKDIRLLFKGPILDLEVACPDFIASWQNEAHVAPGLLENALYLMKEMREWEDHPILYHVTCRLPKRSRKRRSG